MSGGIPTRSEYTSDILRALSEGPKTAWQVTVSISGEGSSLDEAYRRVQNVLRYLHTSGQIEVIGTVQNGSTRSYLYNALPNPPAELTKYELAEKALDHYTGGAVFDYTSLARDFGVSVDLARETINWLDRRGAIVKANLPRAKVGEPRRYTLSKGRFRI